MRLNGSQIVALIFAILLLLPGGCFVLLTISFAKADFRQHLSVLETIADTRQLWVMAVIILAPAGVLFWVAFRRLAL